MDRQQNHARHGINDRVEIALVVEDPKRRSEIEAMLTASGIRAAPLDSARINLYGRRPSVVLFDYDDYVRRSELHPAELDRTRREASILVMIQSPALLDVAHGDTMVDGWVLMDVDGVAMREQIALGSEGHSVVPKALLSPQGADEIRVRLLPRLTETEHEVLSLMGFGLTNSEIGERLGVGEKTIAGISRNVRLKMHFPNRTVAGVFAARHLKQHPDQEQMIA